MWSQKPLLVPKACRFLSLSPQTQPEQAHQTFRISRIVGPTIPDKSSFSSFLNKNKKEDRLMGLLFRVGPYEFQIQPTQSVEKEQVTREKSA